MCSGPGQEVVHCLVLDGNGRILKAEQVFQRRLQVARDQAHGCLPSQCMAATTKRLRRWKYGLPVDGVVLVTPRHVPDRGAGQRHGRISVLPRPAGP